MAKVIVITKCNECPHDNDLSALYDCKKYKRNNHSYPEIPDWCKLDDDERKVPMRNYQSIQDHDLLQERCTNLHKFTLFIILLAAGIVASVAVFDGIATVQEQREASTIEKIDNAKVGSFIRVGDSGLLKMSQRRDK